MLLVALAACSSDATNTSGAPPTPSSAGDVHVSFDDASARTLAPGAELELAARVSPADGRAVRFALLDDAADSSLADVEIASDAEGLARTRLRAASRAVTFRVRATSGAAAATRTISVGGAGTASIAVTARYDGKRAATAWTATASTSGRCSDLSTPVRPDGPLEAAGPSMRIDGVPVGARVVVAVRSGHAIGGCAELDDLSLGEVRELAVTATDAPLLVAPLTATLGLVPPLGPPPALIAEWRDRFMKQLLGGAATPWSALLDAVATSLPAPSAPAFLAAREASGWDADAQASSPDAGAALAAWLDAGAARLSIGLPLEARLKSDAADGTATLALLSAGGAALDPASAPARAASWAALPGDVARLSADLTLPPSRLVAAALETVAGASGDARLEAALGCAALSKALASKAALSCDAACFSAACKAAASAMWQRARRGDEIAGKFAKLGVTATLDASVDAESTLTHAVGTASVKLTSGSAEWASDASASLSVVQPD